MLETSALGINFSQFEGIFKLEKTIASIRRDFETKIGGKKCVLYTGIYSNYSKHNDIL